MFFYRNVSQSIMWRGHWHCLSIQNQDKIYSLNCIIFTIFCNKSLWMQLNIKQTSIFTKKRDDATNVKEGGGKYTKEILTQKLMWVDDNRFLVTHSCLTCNRLSFTSLYYVKISILLSAVQKLALLSEIPERSLPLWAVSTDYASDIRIRVQINNNSGRSLVCFCIFKKNKAAVASCIVSAVMSQACILDFIASNKPQWPAIVSFNRTNSQSEWKRVTAELDVGPVKLITTLSKSSRRKQELFVPTLTLARNKVKLTQTGTFPGFGTR